MLDRSICQKCEQELLKGRTSSNYGQWVCAISAHRSRYGVLLLSEGSNPPPGCPRALEHALVEGMKHD